MFENGKREWQLKNKHSSESSQTFSDRNNTSRKFRYERSYFHTIIRASFFSLQAMLIDGLQPIPFVCEFQTFG